MNTSVIYLVVLIVYLVVLLGIGICFYHRNKNVSDYILGARRLGPFVSAMSAQASDMSGWLLMGVPGVAYFLWGGTAEAFWTVFGLWVGTYFNWLLIARRLRQFTGRLGALTIPDYFARRFEDRSGILRVVSALFILLFFLFYTASMFSAGAKLFHSIFGLSYHASLVLGSTVIVSYTFLGGFLAVCWTDMIQGILMLFALVCIPVMAFYGIEGNIAEAIHHASGRADFSLFACRDGRLGPLFIISCFGWGLGYFGQPHILPRFMGIHATGEIPTARRVAMAWVTISLAAAVLCGIAGAVLIPNLEDSETVFIILTQRLCSPIIAGVLLTAILSAIMSTADSQLLAASSAAASDLWRDTFRPDADETSTLRISRLTVLLVSVAAILIVYIENPLPGTILGRLNGSVFELVAFAWAGFGSAFGPVVLLSLYWRRMSLFGAIAGIMAGGMTALIWRFLSGGIFDIYELVPGFCISLLAVVLVSLLGRRNDRLSVLFAQLCE